MRVEGLRVEGVGVKVYPIGVVSLMSIVGPPGRPHEIIQANRIKPFQKGLYGSEGLSGLHVLIAIQTLLNLFYSVRLDILVWEGRSTLKSLRYAVEQIRHI